MRVHGIPSELVDALLSGIAADPEARWATMEPIVAALRESVAGVHRRSPVLGRMRTVGGLVARAASWLAGRGKRPRPGAGG